MFIDTHLHLSKEDYENIEDVVLNAKKANVNYLIVSCCSMNEIKNGISDLLKYDNVFLSIGLHPSEAKSYSDEDLDEIKKLFMSYKEKIVAIGEIGLDYYYDKSNIGEQQTLFKKQLKIAEELNVPVVIHSRSATLDTINILKQFKVKGVIHCFSGSLETANIYIKMGYKLGIGGVLTFKNSNLKDVISNIEISSIVLETDSPYLSPVPYRGEKNEPKNIPIIADFLANITKKDIKEIEIQTYNNAIEVFDLKI